MKERVDNLNVNDPTSVTPDNQAISKPENGSQPQISQNIENLSILTAENSVLTGENPTIIITDVSSNITEPSLHTYIDLYASDSSFSSHLEEITKSNYEVEHITSSLPATTDITSNLPSNTDIRPQPEQTNAIKQSLPTASPSNLLPLTEILRLFCSQFQVGDNTHEIAEPTPTPTVRLEAPTPPIPPMQLANDPFPEVQPIRLPKPDLPASVEWPLKFKDSAANAMALPFIQDLSKSIKSQRRADFLRSSMARDNMPHWAYQLEQIPSHWILDNTTKETLKALQQEHARAVTATVLSGMQANADNHRSTLARRLQFISDSEQITPDEKSATTQLIGWLEQLDSNHINMTLHNQWSFLTRNPASDKLDAHLFSEDTNRQSRPNRPQARPAGQARDTTTTGRPNQPRTQTRPSRPTNTRDHRRPTGGNNRSRSPLPSTSRTDTRSTSNNRRQNSETFETFQRFLQFQRWESDQNRRTHNFNKKH